MSEYRDIARSLLATEARQEEIWGGKVAAALASASEAGNQNSEVVVERVTFRYVAWFERHGEEMNPLGEGRIVVVIDGEEQFGKLADLREGRIRWTREDEE